MPVSHVPAACRCAVGHDVRTVPKRLVGLRAV
jgi:hypothetical protein